MNPVILPETTTDPFTHAHTCTEECPSCHFPKEPANSDHKTTLDPSHLEEHKFPMSKDYLAQLKEKAYHETQII